MQRLCLYETGTLTCHDSVNEDEDVATSHRQRAHSGYLAASQEDSPKHDAYALSSEAWLHCQFIHLFTLECLTNPRPD